MTYGEDFQRVKFLSYCCYFQCGLAHDVGFVDPELAEQHMRHVHNSNRKPRIKRWPHSVETYQHFGVQGPLR